MRIERAHFLSLVSAIAGAVLLVPALGACNAALGIESARLMDGDGGKGPSPAVQAPIPASPTDVVDAGMDAEDAAPRNACGDTRTDAKNCGACGHDCRGGACAESRCQPVVFSSGQSIPDQLALGGTDLYWITRTRLGPVTGLLHCPFVDCFGGPKITQGVPGPVSDGLAFAVDGANVAWTAMADLWWTGPSIGMNHIRGGITNTLWGPVVSDGSLYWMNHDSGHGADGIAPTHSYVTCTLPGCTDMRTVHQGGAYERGSFTVARGNIYFAMRAPGATAWGIATCPTSGCGAAPVILSARGELAVQLVTDGDHLVWSSLEVPLSTCDLPGCSGGPRTLVARGSVNNVTMDAAHAYFIDGQKQTVNRCALGGCGETPEILADAQRNPGSLAVAEKDIYWTADSSILRLAK